MKPGIGFDGAPFDFDILRPENNYVLIERRLYIFKFSFETEFVDPC